MNYDLIVVGARCAGAALATLQARSGARVLMLDAHAMPSDQPMSTHYLHTPGMDLLDELGIGEAVRARTTPTRRFRVDMDGHSAYLEYPEDRPGWCPRRQMLDPLLLEAAQNAGVELRDRTRVVELVKEGDRVTGVVAESDRGRETIRANLVVGADGRHSTIAKLTGVEEYLTFKTRRSGYWFYAPAPRMWHEDERYRDWDGLIAWQGKDLRYIFQTDNDELILVGTPPSEDIAAWKGDYVGNTLKYLEGSELLAPLAREIKPPAKGVGLLKAEWFYRRPVGPGFALVGDAGYTKDFITGHGITDALVSARDLHRAILVGTDAAYERFWRERDVNSMEMYFDSEIKGDLGYNNRFMQGVFAMLGRKPERQERFYRISDRTLSPFKAFSMGELLGVVGWELLHGNFGVLPDFLATGKRLSGYKAEIAGARARLAALPA